MRFERITINPDQMGGQPCIRGLRIPVTRVVAMVADGTNPDEVVAALPDLSTEDTSETLHYAAAAVQERISASALGPSARLVPWDRRSPVPFGSRPDTRPGDRPDPKK